MKNTVEARKPVFSKIFRWRPSNGQIEMPMEVAVVGTFTNWKKVPMSREMSGGWQVTFKQVPGNHTHRYMLLADGKPVHDENCDGLAIPQGAHEAQFAIATPRGPRVFMLFAQTK